jgi:hypothetical protein
MFILVSIPVGIVLGWLLGGRLDGLAGVRLHWVGLAIAGVLFQLLLFTPVGGDVFGSWLPAAYVASNLAVFTVVLRNLAIPGVWLIALGAATNLLAIMANGGLMPAAPAAVEASGITIHDVTNSIVLEDPVLRPLTDIFAIPAGLPMANVFSVGDVLIALGVAVTIALAMRRGREPGSGRAGGPL